MNELFAEHEVDFNLPGETFSSPGALEVMIPEAIEAHADYCRANGLIYDEPASAQVTRWVDNQTPVMTLANVNGVIGEYKGRFNPCQSPPAYFWERI